MKSIDNLDQVLDMVSGSISDISYCQDDLDKFDDEFLHRYPDYSKLEDGSQAKIMMDEIKNELILFRKRTYIRTAFSYIEGVLFAMKRIILEHPDKLSVQDKIKLQEYKLVGPNNNELEERPVFLPLEENMKFTFKKYGEIKAKNYQIDSNCNEWNKFMESIKIRNRITHPKLSSDLLISDDELQMIKKSYDWFYHILNELHGKENHY